MVFQNLLSLSPNQRKDMVQKEMGTIDRRPLATLKDYAINYFRYLRNFASLFPLLAEINTPPPH